MALQPVRLLIHGASGRMGQGLLRLAQSDPRFTVVAAVSSTGSPPTDSPAGCPWFAAARLKEVAPFDVAVDFSLPAALGALVGLCADRGSALVCGTTGLDAAQMTELQELADRSPVLWASNFSLGVAVLEDLLRRASAALPTWDLKIVETHHVHKKDAPSGTALTLARAAASAGGRMPEIESIRAGEVVGDHAATFNGPGEILELAHRAQDRAIFVRGALEASHLLRGRPAGLYRLGELLFGSD